MFKFVNKKNRTVAAFLLVCCITVSMLYSTPAYALEVTQTDVKMYTTYISCQYYLTFAYTLLQLVLLPVPLHLFL